MNQISSLNTTSWLLAVLLAMAPPLWAEEEKPAPSIEYLPLGSKLIVNLAGHHRYLRADAQLMVTGKENLERLQPYLPVVRHTLITLLSNLPPEQVADVEQREKFRQEALAKVRAALDQYSSSEGLNDILFTEFLVQ